MSEILVIGHRNPDTDAICSAIAYAEFKRRTGMREVVAARCGDVHDRTDFVLRTFNVPAPKFVADVSPTVRDVMATNVISSGPRTSMFDALSLMDTKNIRVLPILDEERRCKGLLSVFKASKFFFPSPNRIFDSRRVVGSIRGIARTLGAKMICAFEPDRDEDLVLMVGAMKPSSFAARLANYTPEKLLVVVGDREDIQITAIQERVRVVIVTGGLSLSDDIHQLARKHEVSLLLSPHDSATTAMLCRAAIPVSHLLRDDYLSFGADERLEDVQRLAAASQFQAFPVVDEEERVVGMLSKSDFLRKVERKLILVDHNELGQAVHGAEKVEIIEILDHHRLGAFTTSQPILFRNEPVGSTSTIVADCFFRHHVEMTPSIAGLLLAGLVSDTLNLTSPTTTRTDADILARLEKISGVNAKEFTEKLFSSGSVLMSKPAEQAITTDCKEYKEGEATFSVAQIEELGFEQFQIRKEEVRKALEEYRSSHNYTFSALLVTDVVQQTSRLLIAGTQRFKDLIEYPEIEPGIFELNGIVSRKKQLLPFLIDRLIQLH
ncbi:MAG TPA: putative manganese-dependent inorganic diphosphatase [Candidatus Limnocylindria bacterium]|jgi:manganese-dependent inorganic pyrophosphatase|nr:putative manganese-dependent inorganic diphosphatase [Candidatus Limnocylindria bacterium]